MNAPAAIAAQLVDMRNIGTHKVLRLTIHVPEEQALAAIAAFGWPTGVNPVPIAIARLNTGGGHVTEPKVLAPPHQKEAAGGEKQAFRDMRMANQAGMLCKEVPFQKFIAERQGYVRKEVFPETQAADYVKKYCGVASRADIRPRCPSGERWTKLHSEYKMWMHEVV
jgi:hypothetical protein